MSECRQDSAGVDPKELPGEGVPPEARASAGRARKLRSDCKFTDLQIYIEIISHMGILSYVALSLGIRRPALYRRIDRAPLLQAARDAARAVVVKVAWEQLGQAIDAKAPWALMFSMDCLLGVPASSSVPRESGSDQASTQSKTPKELVPQPEKADASTLRLIRAVERGEPWAIKYCLKHLEPNGYCGINRIRRGEENDGDGNFEADAPEPLTEVPQKLPGYDQATEHAIARLGDLVGTIKAPAAPPVLKPVPAPQTAAEAVVQTAVESASSAPPVSNPESSTPVLPTIEAIHRASPPGSSANRTVADFAPPVLELKHPRLPESSSPDDRPEVQIKDSQFDWDFPSGPSGGPPPTGFG